MCYLIKMWFLGKMCYFETKCVLWNVLCEFCVGNTVFPFVGFSVNAWCNFWIHTKVIVMHTGVHAMMTLKCLRMRHAFDSDMQINIWNAFCMLSVARIYNDVLVTIFCLSDADYDFACGFAIPANLLKSVPT